jgi:AraC family transcriptional regulator
MMRGRGTVTRRGRGIFQTTYATPGALWLCPKGVAVDFLELSDGEVEIAHIYLAPDQFSDDLGDRFEEAELNYLGGFRDPLVEQIARAILSEMQTESSSGQMLVQTLSRSLAVRLRHSYSVRSIPGA